MASMASKAKGKPGKRKREATRKKKALEAERLQKQEQHEETARPDRRQDQRRQAAAAEAVAAGSRGKANSDGRVQLRSRSPAPKGAGPGSMERAVAKCLRHADPNTKAPFISIDGGGWAHCKDVVQWVAAEGAGWWTDHDIQDEMEHSWCPRRRAHRYQIHDDHIRARWNVSIAQVKGSTRGDGYNLR